MNKLQIKKLTDELELANKSLQKVRAENDFEYKSHNLTKDRLEKMTVQFSAAKVQVAEEQDKLAKLN